jgi:dTDP-4-dehydrorhamnose reductase
MIQDPFKNVLEKKLTPLTSLWASFVNKIVIITGGEGFIGTALTSRLYNLGVKKVITIDLKNSATYQGCVSVLPLSKIFLKEKPDFCFHLAAERLPNKAEENPYNAIKANIEGTKNIIAACKLTDCKLIFSSTGKASRIITQDIYAGTKKVAEWLVSNYANSSIVRFTHVAENSPVTADIKNKIQNHLMTGANIILHAPNRYITAQNLSEAVILLLNAAVSKYKCSAVATLEWPVCVDDILKYWWQQKNQTKPVCVYYSGIPKGYEEYVFAGQINIKTPLVGTLEKPLQNINGIITFDLVPIDTTLLLQDITPKTLNTIIYEIALSGLKNLNPTLLYKVFEEGVKAPDYQYDTVAKVLINALRPL